MTALEPMNGTVDGRDKDRARGLMDTLKAGQRKVYEYEIEAVTDKSAMEALAKLK